MDNFYLKAATHRNVFYLGRDGALRRPRVSTRIDKARSPQRGDPT